MKALKVKITPVILILTMASSHYTWFHDLPALLHENTKYFPDTEKLLLGAGLATLLIYLGASATRKIRSSETAVQSHIEPSKGSKLFNFFDVLIDCFVKYHDSVLGKENRKHIPISASLFIFIFASNLLGLVPGFAAITTTVWINVGMALIVFLYFNFYGIKENGLVGYFKHFCGPVWWIAWLIFPLEILSTCLRVLTLNLRLYWNITADHVVLGVFTELTKVVVPVLFYALGTFVSFMQAFVFTTLTMVYVLLATQHEESDHDDHSQKKAAH